MKRNDATSAWLQVLPTWAVLGLFFLVPLGIVFLISFAPADEFGDPAKVENFGAYVKSGEFAHNYKDAGEPAAMRRIQMAGMRQNFSWDASARQYEAAYERAKIVKR